MTTKWQELAVTSHYQTAVAVKDALSQGDLPNATAGIEELIDALTRSEKRAVRSHLIRLMSHIVKWHSQPEMRTRSWTFTIRHARREIAESRDETPSLTREVIESMWNKCFDAACDEAEVEMGESSTVESLTWEQVFDEGYELPLPPKRRKRGQQ